MSRIQLRRDTAANWTSANPVLAAGEPGFETDTRQEKRGDGSSAWSALPYITVTREAPLNPLHPQFGGVGDGVTDDSTALQSWATALGFANRGGDAILPGRRYRWKVTTPIQFTGVSGATIRGESGRALINNLNSTTKGQSYEGASVIVNACSSGNPAIQIIGTDTAAGPGTDNLTFEHISIKNNASTTHGIEIDSKGGTATKETFGIDFRFVTVTGGDRAWYLHTSTGGDGPWDIDLFRCEVTDNNSQFPNYAVYADGGTTLGIASAIRRCRFVGLNNNAIYINGGGNMDLTVEDCVIEETGQEGIWSLGAAGDILRIFGGHMEQCWSLSGAVTAFYTGGRYQRSSGDAVPAAFIRVGNASNVPTVTSINGLHANLADSILSTDGLHMFPLVNAYTGQLQITDTDAGPYVGTLIKQPLITTNGFTVTTILDGLRPTKPLSGVGLVGGSAFPITWGWNQDLARVQPGLMLGVGSNRNGPTISGGSGAPAEAGLVGDIYIRTDGGVGTTLYRCTVAGGAGAATWSAIL